MSTWVRVTGKGKHKCKLRVIRKGDVRVRTRIRVTERLRFKGNVIVEVSTRVGETR